MLESDMGSTLKDQEVYKSFINFHQLGQRVTLVLSAYPLSVDVSGITDNKAHNMFFKS